MPLHAAFDVTGYAIAITIFFDILPRAAAITLP